MRQSPKRTWPLREDLVADLGLHERLAKKTIDQLTARIHGIKRERFKWAEKAMVGAVPDDIAAEKQRQLAAQLLKAESELSRQARLGDVHRRALDTVLELIQHAGRTYVEVDKPVKRSFNQAWFDHLFIDEGEQAVRVVHAGRSQLTEALHAAVTARAADPAGNEKRKTRQPGWLPGRRRTGGRFEHRVFGGGEGT